MLYPKKVKHRKWQKIKSKTKTTRGADLSFGDYGLKAMECKPITSRQIEAGRRAIIRYLRKGGKMWTRIFPDRPITTKGAEVPMGGGKGAVDHYAFVIEPGRIIYELSGIPEDQAREAFRKASDKFGIKTKFIKRDHVG